MLEAHPNLEGRFRALVDPPGAPEGAWRLILDNWRLVLEPWRNILEPLEADTSDLEAHTDVLDAQPGVLELWNITCHGTI
jgi:hypothetical protein